MDGLSRESGTALVDGKGRGTQGQAGLETDSAGLKRDGCKAQAHALPVCGGLTMRRWKPKRGRSVIENIKRVSLAGSISARTKTLKTDRKT